MEKYQSLVHRICQVAKTHPDHCAVVCGDIELSYRTLLIRASSLVNQLQTRFGVKRGDRVGLYLDWSENAIVAKVAVVLTGAAYVPLGL
jgi:N-(5-amino-5-carboxypentanoyl)-L-cysteinyl-D-valine synthase